MGAPEQAGAGERPDEDNEAETVDRAAAVVRVLERCEEELFRLESIPAISAERVNGISMALGFVKRARAALSQVS